MSRQRVIKWTEPIFNVPWQWGDSSRSSDLNYGNTKYFEIDLKTLTKCSPELSQAFSPNGKIGKITDHSHSVEGSFRIWTFVIEFD